ncbi:MAG: hypothetical protein E6R04_07155 [Spirochaetes bacterium]|nr:MAG: hypothetical protein E6R04_07155 [Spirochaetota bacterium]
MQPEPGCKRQYEDQRIRVDDLSSLDILQCGFCFSLYDVLIILTGGFPRSGPENPNFRMGSLEVNPHDNTMFFAVKATNQITNLQPF